MAQIATDTQPSACGSVASDLSVASIAPTSAVVDRIMPAKVWPKAWARQSCATVRLADIMAKA